MSGKQLRRREEAQHQPGPQPVPGGPHPQASRRLQRGQRLGKAQRQLSEAGPCHTSQVKGGCGPLAGGGAEAVLGPLTVPRHPPC